MRYLEQHAQRMLNLLLVFALRGERWKLLCITSLIWALSDLIGSL